MKPSPRDLMVARAVREACVLAVPGSFRAMPRDPMVMRDTIEDVDLVALIEALPEPASPEIDAETERFVRIGKLFLELWEAGAPWPVRHWTCDKHKVKGCLRCKTTTAP